MSVIPEAKKMRGCKYRPMENKKCVGVGRDQWRTSIAWVKRCGNIGHVGVLKLYKVYNFGWCQCLLAVLTPNSSFVCMKSLSLLSCSTQTSPLMNKNIRLFIYICVPCCLSSSNGCILHVGFVRLHGAISCNSQE